MHFSGTLLHFHWIIFELLLSWFESLTLLNHIQLKWNITVVTTHPFILFNNFSATCAAAPIFKKYFILWYFIFDIIFLSYLCNFIYFISIWYFITPEYYYIWTWFTKCSIDVSFYETFVVLSFARYLKVQTIHSFMTQVLTI